MKQDNFDSLNNEACKLILQKEYVSAITLLEKSLNIFRTPEALGNIGIAHFRNGDIEKSLLFLNESIETQVEPNTLYYLGCAYIYLHKLDLALSAFEKLINIGKIKWIKLISGYYLTILYLRSDLIKIHEYMNFISELDFELKDELDVKNSAAYINLIARLVLYDQANYLNEESLKSEKVCYVIGDSHSLSFKNIQFEYNLSEFKNEIRWIPGIKLFHIVQKKENPFKASFNKQFESIPANSCVILSIGEIDLREDEGVLSYSKKSCVQINAVIESMVKDFEIIVKDIIQKKNLYIILTGVHLPNAMSNPSVERVNMIRFFNEKMIKLCLSDNNIAFINTNDTIDFFNNIKNNAFIDEKHLVPECYAKSINDYLYVARLHKGVRFITRNNNLKKIIFLNEFFKSMNITKISEVLVLINSKFNMNDTNIEIINKCELIMDKMIGE